MSSCEAVQKSDQMYCDKCGLVWDVNDPYPPACVRAGDTAIRMLFVMFLVMVHLGMIVMWGVMR